jgi:hypothetical protein
MECQKSLDAVILGNFSGKTQSPLASKHSRGERFLGSINVVTAKINGPRSLTENSTDTIMTPALKVRAYLIGLSFSER